MAQRAVSRQDSSKISLPSAPDLALGKVFFIFFNSLPSVRTADTRQREVFFLKKNSLPSASRPGTRQRGSFAERQTQTLGKPFLFFFFRPPNFFCSPHTIPGTPCSNVAHFSDFFYISLIYFI